MYYTEYNSPIGKLKLASDGENLVGLWIEGQKYYACCLEDNIEYKDDLPVFVLAYKWLDIYFNGKNPQFNLPLRPQGNEFRQEVWKILQTIAYGEVRTYGDIAKQIAHQRGLAKMSAQAVGIAVSHNPISIVIPCHRVIGQRGNLTGYAAGLDVKSKLLKLEKVNV